MNIKERIKYYINPDFLEKSGIVNSINYLLKKYENNLKGKSLLDIGCGSKPYQYLFDKLKINYAGIDFTNFSSNYSYTQLKPDFHFSKNYKKNFKLSQLKNNSYDIITAFQVLEHHKRPDIFFSEIKRILKPKGSLIISFPFIWELHEEPNDFQRLTHYKIEKLCLTYGLRVKEILKRGSVVSVISQLLNLSLKNLNLFPIIKKIIFMLILVPLQLISYFYDKNMLNPERKIFLGYTFLIQKK